MPIYIETSGFLKNTEETHAKYRSPTPGVAQDPVDPVATFLFLLEMTFLYFSRFHSGTMTYRIVSELFDK